MTQTALQIELPPPPIPHPSQPGNLPDWIAKQLHTNTPAERTRAQFHYCPTCNEIVLTGLDAPIAAFRATADPTPITPHQEQALKFIGRQTYTAHPLNNPPGYELADRRGTNHKYDNKGTIVIPAHKCGARYPGFITPPKQKKETTNDEPPF